jgi:hypothetical protein
MTVATDDVKPALGSHAKAARRLGVSDATYWRKKLHLQLEVIDLDGQDLVVLESVDRLIEKKRAAAAAAKQSDPAPSEAA